MLRRLALLTFCLGCLVAVLAAGRFTPRLILDGMISFAFVPVSEMAGFAVARRFLAAPGPFTHDAERFLRGNFPWLLWVVAVVAANAAAAAPLSFDTLNLMLLGAVLPLAASIWVDYQFFLDARRNTPRRAALAVIAQRAVAWPLVLFYFLGMAVSARDVTHTVVELRQMAGDAVKAVGR